MNPNLSRRIAAASQRKFKATKHPIATALMNVSKITDHQAFLRGLQLAGESALDEIMHKRGTREHLGVLVQFHNMTQSLIEAGVGADHEHVTDASVAAIQAIAQRHVTWGKVQATPAELEALRQLILLHDAQMGTVSVAQFTKAVDRTEAVLKNNRATRLPERKQ